MWWGAKQTWTLRNRIFDFLRRQPKTVLLAVGYLLVFLIGAVDYVTPPDLSFLIFYLIPIALVTFFVGTWEGIFLSVACAAAWFLANTQEFFPRSHSIIPYWNVVEKLSFFFLLTYIVSALKNALAREKEMARVDPLTSLPNRRRFQEILLSEITRARRYKRVFTFVYLDLDGFKAVNDRLGHAAGDALLRAVAETIRRNVRDVDTPARFGGDEFALLLPETGYDAARTAVGHLHKSLLQALEACGEPVTVTIGAVTYASPIHSAEEIIGTADRLMYTGKAGGKNTVTHKIVGEPAA